MNTPLSNIQIELLKTFSHNVSDQDLHEVKRLITGYFGQKAINEANLKWDEDNWSEGKLEQVLKSHKRTPYPRKTNQ